MEFSVCVFKWLLYPFYVFYNVQCSYQIHIHLRSIPHQTDDGMGFPMETWVSIPMLWIHASKFSSCSGFVFCFSTIIIPLTSFMIKRFLSSLPTLLSYKKRKTPQRISLRSPICPSKEKNNKTNRLFLTVKFTLNLWKHGKNKSMQLQQNYFES